MLGLLNQDRYPQEFLIHRKYAQSNTLLELVWFHSNIITDLALTLYDSGRFEVAGLARDYLTRAALLHDVGTYRCQGFEWLPDQPPQTESYIQHVLVGAWILQQEGFDYYLVQTARNHTGVGLTTADITRYGLDLPVDNYLPTSLVEQLVCYAAKFHSKAPKFKTAEEVKASLAKFDQVKVKRFVEFTAYFGGVDLAPLRERYEPWEKTFHYKVEHLKQNQLSADLNSAGIARH